MLTIELELDEKYCRLKTGKECRLIYRGYRINASCFWFQGAYPADDYLSYDKNTNYHLRCPQCLEKEKEQNHDNCYVCGAICDEEHSDDWYYFRELFVCKYHNGASEWYNGALKMVNEKMQLLLEEKEQSNNDKN